MALVLTFYYVRIDSIQINEKCNEKRENAIMSLEDHRIPLFISEDGIVLALHEKPMMVIAEEYQDRCRIENDKEANTEDKISIWLWELLKYIE